MTNAILRGKPDAGNPHVRFDEGEVASVKPRRGSLLYIRMALLSFVALLAISVRGSAVTWTSGTIYLPNGQKAAAGDVTGYLFSTTNPNYIHKALFYDLIHEGITTKTVYTTVESGGRTHDVGAFVTSGVSDSKGQINLTEKGLVTGGEYNNQWAKVYYICIQDGYEYYMAINGDHYETSPYNLRYQDLASYGTWKRGYEVPESTPEPTSSMLVLLGAMFICLRRRKIHSV